MMNTLTNVAFDFYVARPFIKDPSTDVAVALAIASSLVERALPADMAFFGEVGLGGELRPVAQSERRLTEAATMVGWCRCAG